MGKGAHDPEVLVPSRLKQLRNLTEVEEQRVHPGWRVSAEALPISKALSRTADGSSVSRLSRASLSVTVIVETAAGVRAVLMPSIYASRNKELEVVVVVEGVEWVAG